MPHIPDLTGQRVDHYQLIRLLGSGGSGAVYLAKSDIHQAQVAVKILHVPLDTDTIAAFLVEAQSVLLEHPHIVRLKKFGQYQQYPFFVMPYLEHGNFRYHYPPGKKNSWEVILPHVKQIASALQYVHEQGIVHRDVKPENMLMDERGNALLSDFGIAVTSFTLNHAMQISSGTLPYMAPEQIDGMAGRASDQYALGIVIYEWLTGQRPFAGDAESLVKQHKQVPVRSMRRIVPTIHPLLDALVMKMLEKRHEKRFASMREVLVEIDTISAAMVDAPSVKTRLSNFTAHTHAVQTLAWSPDGKYLASGAYDKVILVWDATTGQVIYTYHGHTGAIWSLAWSADSRLLLSVGGDEVVQIWEATTGYTFTSYPEHHGTIRAASWSPDGVHVAWAGDNTIVKVYNRHTRQLVHSYEEHCQGIFCLAWSPDNRYLASGDNEAVIRVWDAMTGEHLRAYRRHVDRVNALAWSPDGKYLASASDDGSFLIWEIYTGRLVYTCSEHTDIVSSVAWSPDGKYLVSGSYDQTVRLWSWDATRKITCLHVYRGHQQWVNTVAWSPDSKYIASGSWDKTVHLLSLDALL